jgi:DNA replication protein DnaC
MIPIAEYLSRRGITASPRFNFRVPETVDSDLLQCFSHAVGLSGKTIRQTADVEKILRSASNWMKSGKRGLLLHGSCGTGKTKLMQALSHLFSYYESDRNSLRVCSATEIADLSLSKTESDAVKFSMLKTANYVGIDDVGTEPVNVKNWGTDTSPVIDVMYCRYNAMKVTVLSTNLNMEAIRKTYGERIFDRICEMYDRISFNFQSFRQQ